MRFLVFHLHGPFASWGDIAVGEVRPSFEAPTRSALLGLISGALGISREAQKEAVTLKDFLRFAVRVERQGHFMEEYQTISFPEGRGHDKARTRKQELVFSQDNTMQSYREHYMDAVYTIFLTTHNNAKSDLLEDIEHALRHPHYVPFLGRKACPLDIPMLPRIISAPTLQAALASKEAEIPASISSILFPNATAQPSQRRRLVIADAAFDTWSWLTEETRTNEPGSRTSWHFSKNRVRIGFDVELPNEEN